MTGFWFTARINAYRMDSSTRIMRTLVDVHRASVGFVRAALIESVERRLSKP